MTYPVFATGDVLNASDMNAVGLWLVKTQTVGSGVASVTVSDAFSSAYQNYRIMYAGGTMSASTALTLKLGTATAGVYGGLVYVNYATTGVAGAADNNAAVFSYFGGGDSENAVGMMDLMSPYEADRTRVSAMLMHYGNFFGTYTGIMADNTQYTAFTLAPASGTMTGGTIRVYGYRN